MPTSDSKSTTLSQVTTTTLRITIRTQKQSIHEQRTTITTQHTTLRWSLQQRQSQRLKTLRKSNSPRTARQPKRTPQDPRQQKINENHRTSTTTQKLSTALIRSRRRNGTSTLRWKQSQPEEIRHSHEQPRNATPDPQRQRITCIMLRFRQRRLHQQRRSRLTHVTMQRRHGLTQNDPIPSMISNRSLPQIIY